MASARFSNDDAKPPRKALSHSISNLDIRDMAKNIRDLADFFRPTPNHRHVLSNEDVKGVAKSPSLRRVQSMQLKSPADSAISMNFEEPQWPERTASRGALSLTTKPSFENDRFIPSRSGTSTPTTLHPVNEGLELQDSMTPRPLSSSRRRAPKKPPDILVNSTLAVPMEKSLPESRGFPNMLPTVTFPSPPSSPSSSPKGSPRKSPSNSISSGSSVGAVPVIRPSTSSRGQGRPSTPSASLNEMVIGIRHAKSDGTLRALDVAASPVISGTVTPTAKTENRQSVASEKSWKSRPESVSSFFTARSRRSDSSHSTVTGDEAWQLEPTPEDESTTEEFDRNSSIACEGQKEPAGNIEPATNEDKSAGDGWSRPSVDSARSADSENPDTKNLDGSATRKAGDPGLMSIAQRRRMARNSKLMNPARCGFRPQSPSLADPDRSESPLHHRRFPSSSTSSRRSSLRELILVADKPHGLSLLSSSRDREEQQRRSHSAELDAANDEPKMGKTASPNLFPSPVAAPASSGCSISRIMITETAPEDAPQQSHTLKMSAIMVVADIEAVSSSAASSPAQRFSRIIPRRSESPIPIPIRRSDSPLPVRTSLRSHLNVRPTRHKPPPISIARNPSTGAIERHAIERHPAMGAIERRMSMLKVAHPALGDVPTPPLTPEDRVSRRFSMPARPVATAVPVHPSWVRIPTPGAPTNQPPEPEAAEEEEEELDAKTRDQLLMQRLREKKLEKQREIDEMVAKTVISSQQHEKSQAEERSFQEHVQTANTQDIELRLNRLEKSGDEWLHMMRPLLDSMTRTLEYMQTDTVGTRTDGPGLTMKDFNIDMEAEATPCLTMRTVTRGGQRFESKGSVEPVEPVEPVPHLEPAEPGDDQTRWHSHPVRGDKGRKKSRPKLSGLANLRLDLNKPVPQTPDDNTKPEGAFDEQTTANQPLRSPHTPRTPQEHEFEARLAIQKRMQDQLSMMDELMNRWGGPSLRPESASSRLGSSPSRRADGSIRKGVSSSAASITSTAVGSNVSRVHERHDSALEPVIRDINNKLISRLVTEDKRASG